MNPMEGLIFDHTLPPSHRDRLYVFLKRYSFRLLIRDLLKHQRGALPEELTHYSSLSSVRKYLSALHSLGVLERDSEGRYRLLRSGMGSFGTTLEWFVAELFRREFCADAYYRVSFFRAGYPGGDFDVLASLEGRLIYIEVKSSPPRGIEGPEVEGFLKRLRLLLPDIAIFYVDTELRMKDKMVPLFNESLSALTRGGSEMIRLKREVFHCNHRIFLANSSRDVVNNFRLCLRDFIRAQNWDFLWP